MKFTITFVLATTKDNYTCITTIDANKWEEAVCEAIELARKNNGTVIRIAANEHLEKKP